MLNANEEQNKLLLHKCPNCQAPVKVDRNMQQVTCEYCGYTSVIPLTEREQWENRSIAKGSRLKSNLILSVVLLPVLAVCFICMCFASSEGYKVSAAVAAVQCIFLVIVLVIGFGKRISGGRVAVMCVLLLVVFVMVIPFFSAMFRVDEQREHWLKREEETKDYVQVDTSWPTSGIGKVAPKPALEEADIWENTENKLSLKAISVSEQLYKEYRKACIESGFTENVREYGNSYEAYTKDGCYINTFLTDDGEFFLSIKAPLTLENYLWPEEGIGSLLPEQKQEYGKILEDRNRSFRAEIYRVSEEAYEAYINACKAAGFNVEEYRTYDDFKASDSDGNWVSIFHYSDYYQTMYVSAGINEKESGE